MLHGPVGPREWVPDLPPPPAGPHLPGVRGLWSCAGGGRGAGAAGQCHPVRLLQPWRVPGAPEVGAPGLGPRRGREVLGLQKTGWQEGRCPNTPLCSPPEHKCAVFYGAPAKSKLLSTLCSADVCQCAEGEAGGVGEGDLGWGRGRGPALPHLGLWLQGSALDSGVPWSGGWWRRTATG